MAEADFEATGEVAHRLDKVSVSDLKMTGRVDFCFLPSRQKHLNRQVDAGFGRNTQGRCCIIPGAS